MLAIIVLITLSCTATYARDSRIVGGVTAEPGEFPHQAALEARPCSKRNCVWIFCYECLEWYADRSFVCGAAVIGKNLAITAAHCVDEMKDPQIYINMHDRSQKDQEATEIRIDRVKMHENWDSKGSGFPNDIALLYTIDDMPVDNVIGLAGENDDFTGQTCKISGWGLLEGNGAPPNKLQMTTGKILSNAECSRSDVWGSNINAGHICIEDQQTGSCNGDSGGPMTCGETGKEKLAGITSWGRTGCDTTYPSVYTRISHFRQWIDQNS